MTVEMDMLILMQDSLTKESLKVVNKMVEVVEGKSHDEFIDLCMQIWPCA